MNLDADISREEKQQLLKEVDKLCPVSDNIQNITPVTFELGE
jgi:uncharacterized OsmC-like protein